MITLSMLLLNFERPFSDRALASSAAFRTFGSDDDKWLVLAEELLMIFWGSLVSLVLKIYENACVSSGLLKFLSGRLA